MHITLDGVHFRGGLEKALFTVDHGSLKGWFEAPGVRRNDEPRPLADGSFTAPTLRAGRSVSWSGLILTKTPAEQHRAMEQLAGVCSGRGLSRLTVQHMTDTTWTDVHLTQPPEVTIAAYGRVARYDVELFAPDPRRYGERRSFSNGTNVYHRGNAPAFPVVTIPNGAASYTLTAAGQTFQVSGATAGGTHVIDLRTGRLTRNGVLVVGAVTRADPWTLPPGARQSFSLSPSASFTVEVADTFF